MHILAKNEEHDLEPRSVCALVSPYISDMCCKVVNLYEDELDSDFVVRLQLLTNLL